MEQTIELFVKKERELDIIIFSENHLEKRQVRELTDIFLEKINDIDFPFHIELQISNPRHHNFKMIGKIYNVSLFICFPGKQERNEKVFVFGNNLIPDIFNFCLSLICNMKKIMEIIKGIYDEQLQIMSENQGKDRGQDFSFENINIDNAIADIIEKSKYYKPK